MLARLHNQYPSVNYGLRKEMIYEKEGVISLYEENLQVKLKHVSEPPLPYQKKKASATCRPL